MPITPCWQVLSQTSTKKRQAFNSVCLWRTLETFSPPKVVQGLFSSASYPAVIKQAFSGIIVFSLKTFWHVTVEKAQALIMKWMMAEFMVAAWISESLYCDSVTLTQGLLFKNFYYDRMTVLLYLLPILTFPVVTSNCGSVLNGLIIWYNLNLYVLTLRRL